MRYEGIIYRYLREEKPGLSQSTVARAARTSQPALAGIEAGERPVGADMRSRLDPVVALGARQPGDVRPLYLLACEPALCAFHSDRRGRLAAFADRDVADATGVFFRRLLGAETSVVAAWADFLDTMLALGRTDPAPTFPGGSYLLDQGEPEIVRAQVGQFMSEMVAAWRGRATADESPEADVGNV